MSFRLSRRTIFKGVLLITCLGGTAWWGSQWLQSFQENQRKARLQAQIDKIQINISANSSKCERGVMLTGVEVPFLYEIINGSDQKIENIQFEIGAKKPDYSIPVQLNYTHYGTDRIIKPGERWAECGYTTISSLRDMRDDPTTFIWKTHGVRAKFSESTS